MHVDYKISRIEEDFTAKVLVRFYSGDYKEKEGKQVYERSAKLSEKTYIFDYGTDLDMIRKFLNKELKKLQHTPITEQSNA